MRIRRPIAITLAAAAVAVLAPSAGAAAAAEPDLGMARLTDIYLTQSSTGRKELRFSATIVNVGTAPFELAASRPTSTSEFSVSQRTVNPDGTSSFVPTPAATLVFGGDGHNHWHVNSLERYELQRLDNGVKVGTAAKSGFCFFDTGPFRLALTGAPADAVYTGAGCGVANSLTVTMGLSIGWGDTYHWTLPDQFIDVTNLSGGKYRLVAEADPLGWFNEASRANNVTWVDLSLTTTRKGVSKVKVFRHGPSA